MHYRYRTSKLSVVSIILPLLLLLLALGLSTWWAQLLVLLPTLLLSIYYSKERRKLFRRGVVVLLFILLGTLPLLFIRDGRYPEWLSNRTGWGISSASFETFRVVTLRCCGAVSALFLLLVVNPMHMLLQYLRHSRVPRILTELIELTYRYIFVLQETATNILTAQQSRLGYVGIANRARHSGMLFAQSFILAYSDADKVYRGLLSRGYDEDALAEETEHINISSTKEMLRLEQVSFAYEGSAIPVLQQLSLVVHQGEKIVLLGENGAGKSTLFQLLNAINRPTTGHYYVQGLESDTSRASTRRVRRTVGILFQNSNHQLFCPTVADEIAFGLRNLGLRGEGLEERVNTLLERFNLVDFATTPPYLLSEGQKKWVAIVAILAMEPEILLLDEPTAGLDRLYTTRVLRLIEELHTQGKTIILSTHDMDFAYRWADRAIVMHEGKIISDTPLGTLFSHPDLLTEANLATPSIADYRTLGCAQQSACKESLPLFLPSHSHRALIIGGGKGAYRKALTLHLHAIPFDVIAPKVSSEMAQLISEAGATLYARTYRSGEVWRYTLVVAGTGDKDIDQLIAAECRERSIQVNVLSAPESSTFQLGATGSLQGVRFAIQTTEKLPEVSQILRDKFAQYIEKHLEQEGLQELGCKRRQMLMARRSGDTNAYESARNAYEVAKQAFIDKL